MQNRSVAYFTRTVDRALKVLGAFPPDRAEVSLSDLGRATQIEFSTVFRLLRTLERHGFVSQNRANRRYRLGHRLLELGRIVADHLEVRREALPIMMRLSQDSGETAFLFAYSEGQALCIERVEAWDSPIRVAGRVGMRIPLHAGAGAKVLLAWRTRDEIEACLRVPLSRYTDSTITDPNRLRAELARIRTRGYALSHGERVPGLTAIGAPVRDHTGDVVAALTLDGPTFRLPHRRARELAGAVISDATEISQKLGYTRERAAQTSRRVASAS